MESKPPNVPLCAAFCSTPEPGEPLAECKHQLTANDFYGHTRGMELVPTEIG